MCRISMAPGLPLMIYPSSTLGLFSNVQIFPIWNLPMAMGKYSKWFRECGGDESGNPSSRRKVMKYLANSFIEMSPAVIGGGNRSRGEQGNL